MAAYRRRKLSKKSLVSMCQNSVGYGIRKEAKEFGIKVGFRAARLAAKKICQSAKAQYE